MAGFDAGTSGDIESSTAMQHGEPFNSNIKGPATVARRQVSLTEQDLVTATPLITGSSLPLLVQPSIESVNFIEWVRNNCAFLEAALVTHGAILFRGFKLDGATEFQELIGAISPNLLDYSYRSTPRRQIRDKIYTSTEYPAHQSIPLHNEMAYSRRWPMKIYFFCAKPADEGGETPICDSRRVLERISPRIRELFDRRMVMYVRNYGQGIDLAWEEVFQTRDRSTVESFCAQNDIQTEWRGSTLITRQICQATATHPVSGERVWFNQAHLFHVTNLSADIMNEFMRVQDESELPRNAYYGDGSSIEPSVLDEIRECYDREKRVFRWQKGDVLMLDNMMAAHGRNPYTGSRSVMVGMADPFVNGSI